VDNCVVDTWTECELTRSTLRQQGRQLVSMYLDGESLHVEDNRGVCLDLRSVLIYENYKSGLHTHSYTHDQDKKLLVT